MDKIYKIKTQDGQFFFATTSEVDALIKRAWRRVNKHLSSMTRKQFTRKFYDVLEIYDPYDPADRKYLTTVKMGQMTQAARNLVTKIAKEAAEKRAE